MIERPSRPCSTPRAVLGSARSFPGGRSPYLLCSLQVRRPDSVKSHPREVLTELPNLHPSGSRQGVVQMSLDNALAVSGLSSCTRPPMDHSQIGLAVTDEVDAHVVCCWGLMFPQSQRVQVSGELSERRCGRAYQRLGFPRQCRDTNIPSPHPFNHEPPFFAEKSLVISTRCSVHPPSQPDAAT